MGGLVFLGDAVSQYLWQWQYLFAQDFEMVDQLASSREIRGTESLFSIFTMIELGLQLQLHSKRFYLYIVRNDRIIPIHSWCWSSIEHAG